MKVEKLFLATLFILGIGVFPAVTIAQTKEQQQLNKLYDDSIRFHQKQESNNRQIVQENRRPMYTPPAYTPTYRPSYTPSYRNR